MHGSWLQSTIRMGTLPEVPCSLMDGVCCWWFVACAFIDSPRAEREDPSRMVGDAAAALILWCGSGHLGPERLCDAQSNCGSFDCVRCRHGQWS